MKRVLRRSIRRFSSKVSQLRLSVPNFSRSFSTNTTYISTRPTISPTSHTLSDDDGDDDDDAFEPAPLESHAENERRLSLTLLPCEFCQVQQTSTQLNQHQLTCLQNPRSTRRRNGSPPSVISRPRRRAASDNVRPVPSAPPRPRSPSPTEGFPIPHDLCCPITHVLFCNPVIASDGHTYEKEAIERCLRNGTASPMTREPLVRGQLICNRVVKKLAGDFREECRQKRSLFKYRLDVDVQKSDSEPYYKSKNKSIYRARWITTPPSTSQSNIVLVHLTGDHAEKLVHVYARPNVHPNIVGVFGQVQHTHSGVLLLQESPEVQKLSELMKDGSQRLSLAICDAILLQCAFALQHLTAGKILHEYITADVVLVYQLDVVAGTILVKLNTLESTEALLNGGPPETLSNDFVSETSDVYFFGLLARELYSLELATENVDLTDRRTLFEQCLTTKPEQRPTMDELTGSLYNLVHGENDVFLSTSSQ